MRHWLALGAVVLALAGALVWSEARKVDAPVGPEPILNLIADGERELTRLPVAFRKLPDDEEIKIGNQLEKMYSGWSRQRSQAGEDDIEGYVEKVGAKVAAHAHRKLPYRFHYIPGLDFVNAFALPGGPVYIGGGLMALMTTEDELAAVLGHELEHIDHYHCAERVQVEAALRRSPLGAMVAIPVEVFVAGYSKDQELEADREGTKLATQASHSPQGAIQMFEAFARLFPQTTERATTPPEELSRVAVQTLDGYFRSHPMPAERIAEVRKMIAAGQLPSDDRSTPLLVAYYFLRERAWRAYRMGQPRPPAFLPDKQRRDRQVERFRQFHEAADLATQSLNLKPDQPRALEILAIARLALGDYEAAAEAYRKLLPNDPNVAGGVQAAANQMARQALDAQEFGIAAAIARELLDLQPDLPEALVILAKSQLQTADFAGATATCARLKSRYPGAVNELSLYASGLARMTWTRHQYSQAAELAAQSLALDPDQLELRVLMADAHFALANFSAAAAAYRTAIDMDSSNQALVESYADAAAAIGAQWQASVSPAVEVAGLALMAGDEEPAKLLVQGEPTPEIKGRLGWWYYRAGKYDTAASLVSQALALRPQDLTLQTSMAWIDLQYGHLEDATRRFTAIGNGPPRNSPLMGRAIARWQAHQTDAALKDFAEAVKSAPEWTNPRWVTLLFPAEVAQSVAEMSARLKTPGA